MFIDRYIYFIFIRIARYDTFMIYSDKKFIGKTIQTIRKNAKIKQSELAEKIGISEKHLSKIETGRNLPSLDNFLKMAEVLEFNLEDFGIKTKSSENKYRQTLLKVAYSATNFEVESYCEIIDTLNKILKRKN